ncbi:unnamed protein product, partial [Mesorhabditis belari]|uniref:PPM-type phosphatase domain-containing protein n=1 Tax=Mesorhabditis belari TaxID=2138241 RepID=A0AAF3FFB0_9BILA
MDTGMIVRVVRSAITRVSGEEPPNEEKPPRVAMVVDVADANFIGGFIPAIVEKQKHPYSRPEFLYFTEEETALSADQSVRPVICAKQPEKMPLMAGYAEVINAGKTFENEDQACAKVLNLSQQGTEAEEARDEIGPSNRRVGALRRPSDEDALMGVDVDSSTDASGDGQIRAEAVLFGLYDGHAGSGAALMAAKCLHEHVKSRLCEVLEMILHLDRQESYVLARRKSESAYTGSESSSSTSFPRITSDSLVIGALEAAFVDMDDQIAEEKQTWKIPGGCATLCVLVFLGKVYVANAGDCRAVLVTSDGVRQMSRDHTPATERKRLQTLAYRQPELIGSSFSRLEYSRSLTKKDLKRKVLYRDWFMDGWASKIVRDVDLRPPMISDRLKKKRLLHTIGVSRGLGDHHLLTADDKLAIKPFLSPVPEVQVLSIRSLASVSSLDVLIIASDGLWDVLTNEDAARIVRSSLSSFDEGDPSRYTQAAQELVAMARGNPGDHYRWTLNVGGPASTDDISAFVIPLKYALAPLQNGDDEEDDELLSLDS